jgi:hypothetical protein
VTTGLENWPPPPSHPAIERLLRALMLVERPQATPGNRFTQTFGAAVSCNYGASRSHADIAITASPQNMHARDARRLAVQLLLAADMSEALNAHGLPFPEALSRVDELRKAIGRYALTPAGPLAPPALPAQRSRGDDRDRTGKRQRTGETA